MASLTIGNFVNHESPVPAFMQVEQDLRRQILSGEIPAEARLPRETELAAIYGVSRMTVRRSLEGLETGGLIRRLHGVGTIATPPDVPVTVDLSSMISIAEQIRRQGQEPRTVIDVQTIATPTPLIRAALGLDETETATVIRRVRLADTRPVLINTSWLPTAKFPNLDRAELIDGSLWKTLTTNYGITPASTEEHFELVKASADEARLLHVEEGDTLIRVSGTTFDSKDVPVERCFSLWAGNVRFHFASKRSRRPVAKAKG
ncbi:GntR family transcriptional regulator [Devosia sp. CN2-171]|uniref:GntR family transcriptional regulator n=1 Tax=Devosia sp. CN2-171 TaxID=3400909 RepID=UPI003BF868D7